jgi:hypothetical protein
MTNLVCARLYAISEYSLEDDKGRVPLWVEMTKFEGPVQWIASTCKSEIADVQLSASIAITRLTDVEALGK